ncbi:MAG: hypothetical protein C5B55_04800 [Blastocatellia bacterium]|nr:MAG: hypothetical protein C5B55_04800 [Blastocatellia bacterium]
MRRRISASRILELLSVLLLSGLFIQLAPSLLLDQRRISLYAFDPIVLVLSLAVPIYVVLRFDWAGVIVGGIYLWLMLIAEGNILSAYDDERGRILDSFWLYAGWLVGLVYCAVIYAGMLLIKVRRKGKELSVNSGES